MLATRMSRVVAFWLLGRDGLRTNLRPYHFSERRFSVGGAPYSASLTNDASLDCALSAMGVANSWYETCRR